MGKKQRKQKGRSTAAAQHSSEPTVMGQGNQAWLYLLPAMVFMVMTWDSGELFARVNIYKTFLLFVSVSLLYLFVDVLFRLRNRQKGIDIAALPMGWLLFLSLPFIATLPGLLLHGGEYNHLLGHELTNHLMFMMWVGYLMLCVRGSDALEKLMIVVAVSVLYVVLEGAAGDTGRPKSTFGNTNLYANYLILFLPLLLLLGLPLNLKQSGKQLFQWKEQSGKGYFFLLVFFVGFWGLWQTQTRAAVAGFGGAVVLLLLYLLYLNLKERYQVRGWVFLVGALGLPILLALIFLFVVSQLSDEVIQTSRFLQLGTWEAWASRFMPWQVAISSIQESLLFGYGPGSSYNLFFEYLQGDSRLYTEQRSFKHVHSELLEVMQEGGVFGLLVHLAVLGGLFWIVLKMLQSDKLSNLELRMVLGIGLSLIAYNTHSIFSLATRMTQNEMTMYALVAMLLVLFTKAELQGRLVHRLQWSLPKVIPAHGLFLGLILLSWGIQYPTFLGSTELATLARTQIKTVGDVHTVTEQYQDSSSIYVLHYLANLQIGAKQGEKMNLLLDRMEDMIPHYRDAGYLRFMAYQLNSKGKPDVAKLKALAGDYQSRDQYDPRILLWIARIAAFEKDQETFLQQIRYAAQYYAIQTQQLDISDIEQLQVVAGKIAEGVEIHFDDDKLEIRLSKKLLYRIMDDARKVIDVKQRNRLLKEYMSGYKAVVHHPVTRDSMGQKRAQFTNDLFKQLVTWSALPQ